MKTIIVPSDFSKNADHALKYAINLAKHFPANVVIVNAFDLPYSQNIMSTSLIDIMRETSEKGVKKLADEHKNSGVEISTRSIMGNPIRIVKDLSNYYEDCMVVLGTKGASGIEEVLIGSNAASILHSVSVPVLAIPAQAPLNSANKIIYASDFKSERNDTALARLGKIARALSAEIEVVHVILNNEPEAEAPTTKFDKYFEGVQYTFKNIIANTSNVEEVILKYADEDQADIVSLLAKKYGFLEGLFHTSTTSKVAFHTTRPYLALHES